MTESVELTIKISNDAEIKAYSFAYGGKPVAMINGVGQIHAEAGRKKLLEWVMIGEPGGSMKVVVSKDGQPFKTREKSAIPPPFIKGYDAFEILVA